MNRNFYIFILSIILFSHFTFAAELVNIDTEQLQAMQKDKNALVIDVRTVKEWQQTGVIPHSKKMQFFDENGKYDAEAWVKKFNSLRQSPDQPVILVCRSGNRSSKVGQFLTKQLGMDNIYNLQNGMNGWLQQGQATEIECAKLSDCEPLKP